MAESNIQKRHPNFVDIQFHKFGRLTVLRPKGKTSKGKMLWLCQCECGKRTVKRGEDLRTGAIRSCGCLRDELIGNLNARHRQSRIGHVTSEYWAYHTAKARCRNPHNKSYRNYGGRGIEFRFTSFESWFKELGSKPNPALTVDRINNDGHYEPGNIRWATRWQQQHNKRKRLPE